jgi:hypothetical protein
MRAALIALALLVSGCSAVPAGQWADVGTTGVGLALGAAEANPLVVATLGAKAYAAHQIAAAPAVDQPYLLGALDAFGWGAAANNVCVIAVIVSGGAGAAACPALGLAAGWRVWGAGAAARDRATFDAVCAAERARRPEIVCVYTVAAP